MVGFYTRAVAQIDSCLFKEKNMNQVARIDTAALANLNRAFLGFDRLFDTVERRYANSLQTNFPPYNIDRQGDTYVLTFAVAGFSKEEIDVSVDQEQLIVKGQKPQETDKESESIHKGIAFRDFERVFTLSEHMEVRSAEMKNGLLTVTIERVVPEALQPRKIEVKLLGE